MKFAFKTILSSISLSILMLLQACGGSSSGSSTSTTSSNSNTSNPPSNTGSVSANFVANANTPKFLLMNNGYTGGANASTFTQESSGAITQAGNFTYTGTPHVTQDITGNADFAAGRWVWGTITDTSTNTVKATLDASNRAQATWHYLLINTLSAMPTSGSRTCDNGTFTPPTRMSGTQGGTTGSVTGSSATLSFSTSGATLGFTISTTASGLTASKSYTVNNLGLGTTNISGSLGTNGASIYISDAGNGAIGISGFYFSQMTDGSVYGGVYTFKCS